MKKKILIFASVIVCVIAIGVFILAGKNISPSVGQYLRCDNADILILDNSPIVMSARADNADMFEKYESGDKILVFHDGIMESYPAQTGVYFAIKLADGHISHISETVHRQLYELGWTSAPLKESEDNSENTEYPVSGNVYSSDLFDITTVSSHSLFDRDKIGLAADNAEFINEDDNYHFAVFKFDTYESFNEFLDDFDKNYDSDNSNANDFREKLQGLNEEYFKENSVILIPYYTGAGNVSYDVESLYFDGEICRLNISEQKAGDVGTSVVTSYIKAVGIEKSFLGECNSFDALLVE